LKPLYEIHKDASSWIFLTLTGPGGFYLSFALIVLICHQLWSVWYRRSGPEYRNYVREIEKWLKKIYPLYRSNSIRSKLLVFFKVVCWRFTDSSVTCSWYVLVNTRSGLTLWLRAQIIILQCPVIFLILSNEKKWWVDRSKSVVLQVFECPLRKEMFVLIILSLGKHCWQSVKHKQTCNYRPTYHVAVCLCSTLTMNLYTCTKAKTLHHNEIRSSDLFQNSVNHHHHHHHHLAPQHFVGFRLLNQVSPSSSVLSCFLLVFNVHLFF
jgi:hypothetical protein